MVPFWRQRSLFGPFVMNNLACIWSLFQSLECRLVYVFWTEQYLMSSSTPSLTRTTLQAGWATSPSSPTYKSSSLVATGMTDVVNSVPVLGPQNLVWTRESAQQLWGKGLNWADILVTVSYLPSSFHVNGKIPPPAHDMTCCHVLFHIPRPLTKPAWRIVIPRASQMLHAKYRDSLYFALKERLKQVHLNPWIEWVSFLWNNFSSFSQSWVIAMNFCCTYCLTLSVR